MTLELPSGSPEETQRLGEAIGRLLRGGDVVGLRGELGAGKTCLVRGIARGLELDPDVIYSPSFTLVAEHEGAVRLNHIDLFRLPDPVTRSEAEEIGLEEYLEPEGVTLVEWCEKLHREDVAALSLTIEILILDGNRRRLRMTAATRRGEEILEAVARGRPAG